MEILVSGQKHKLKICEKDQELQKGSSIEIYA